MEIDIYSVKSRGMTSLARDKYELPAVRTAAVMQVIDKVTAKPTGLLPPVLRWYSYSGRFWMFERSPEFHVITYRGAKPEKIAQNEVKEFTYELPIPWTLYLVEIDTALFPSSVSVFATRGPLSDMRDRLGLMPLPNLYEDGHLCPPNDARNVTPPETVADTLTLAYEMLWSGGANTDMSQSLNLCSANMMPSALFEPQHGRPTQKQTLQIWENSKIEDVMEWQWAHPMGFTTVSQLMNRCNNLDEEAANFSAGGTKPLQMALQGVFTVAGANEEM